MTENNEMKLIVQGNFCNRFDRQITITIGSITIDSNIVDSRSDEAKRLSLELIAAARILNHHELNWE